MIEADGIILTTPTYVADLKSEMKALIERAVIVSGSEHNRGKDPLFKLQTMKKLGQNMA
ncbi:MULTISPECIES: hypothetical protein [unclassified Methanosarcina]|uniref:hypothetical protein n=1 Tax=unclassified Methanosarcina TaxID=2644672 RepID=UPI0009E35D74|nr:MULTISPECIES: hypothetical protein [unclassified Methanosarcina]